MRVRFVLMAFLTALFLAVFAMQSHGGRKTRADIVFDGLQEDVLNSEALLNKERELISEDIETLVDLDSLWKKDPEGTPLWVRFVRGILRSRQEKKVNGTKIIVWERCGKDIPKEELYELATEWAISLMASLKEVKAQTGVDINPWGAFATTANEGGFNECSLNYAARRWASKHVGRELITETWKGRTVRRKVDKKVVERFRLTYDKETVWRIITHEDYAKAKVKIVTRLGREKVVHMRNKFDGGPYQIRLSVKKLTRERFDYLMSIYPGVYLGVREMARRAIHYAKWKKMDAPHRRPWTFWPGYLSASRSSEYDRKITSVARWLGARRGEI